MWRFALAPGLARGGGGERGGFALAAACLVLLLGVPVGTRSIEKAVLMDFTLPKSRGRWNALESINRSTWAGSAMAGGYLIEHAGWSAAYYAAAGFVGVAVVVLSALLRVSGV